MGIFTIVEINKNLYIKAFYNNFQYSNYFLKYIGLNGASKKIMGSNYHGTSFFSVISASDGTTKYGHGI